MGRVYVTVKRPGGKRELRPLPDPPAGKSYMVVPVSSELVDKVSRLEASGHWERELSELLGETIERFFLTRPIHIATPGAAVKTF